MVMKPNDCKGCMAPSMSKSMSGMAASMKPENDGVSQNRMASAQIKQSATPTTSQVARSVHVARVLKKHP